MLYNYPKETFKKKFPFKALTSNPRSLRKDQAKPLWETSQDRS
jgi:hypothetical protein